MLRCEDIAVDSDGSGPASRWATASGALRNRSFRWYWLGRLTSLAAFQMDGVAGVRAHWIRAVAGLSDRQPEHHAASILALRWRALGSLQQAEHPHRARWMRLPAHLAIAVLTSVGAIQVWHLAIRSLVAGVLLALIMPAERALVPELVERQTLLNAFALTSIAAGLIGVLAAWAAGFFIDTIGVAACYFVVAFHLLTVIVVARLPNAGRRAEVSNSAWLDLGEALCYVSQRPVLVGLLGLARRTPS